MQRQIRTQKRQYKADGEPEYYVNYVWQDGLLTHQSMTYYFHMTLNGTEKVVELPFTAKFVYDESNTPVGCLVNGEAALAFVRNLQGDIIAVVNQEGTALLEYSYDPWGKVTITQNGENLTEQEAAIIAVLCPFAYRGYNYDYTTGLYYLQSRYYNPEWGRFLNVDDTNILLSTQGENLGANLFAYCNNNPVNRVDYEGRNSTSMPWLAAIFTGLYTLIVLAQSKTQSFVLNHDFAGFNYNEDRYGLIYARLCTKDKNQQKYYVSRVVMGTADSWNTYFKQESKRYKDWGGTMIDFFMYGMQGDPKFTSVQDMKNEGNSGLLFLGTCLVIGGVGAGGIGIFQKSDNITRNTGVSGVSSSGAAIGSLVTTRTWAAALPHLLSNLKPLSYDEFITYRGEKMEKGLYMETAFAPLHLRGVLEIPGVPFSSACTLDFAA